MTFFIKKKLINNKISKIFNIFIKNTKNKNKNKKIELIGKQNTNFTNKIINLNKFKMLKWLLINNSQINQNIIQKITYNFFIKPYKLNEN